MFAPPLPAPRGPLSRWLFDFLRDPDAQITPFPPIASSTTDDLHLALYCCYELHYRGFEGVSAELEWSAPVLRLRSQLESEFLKDLVAEAGGTRTLSPSDAEEALLAIAHGGGGPSLSTIVQREANVDRVRELCVHRSAYQLKEADPHTWAIPRVSGECKAAMIEIQHDEYGAGRAGEMHASLFADTMRSLGLDPTYGAYLDQIPGVTLATTNLISMFGLHRRWRGALVGHLALFEMTSVVPMGRYSDTLSQLGIPDWGRRFYDVHVEADAEHEVIALERMVRGLLVDEPELAADVVFGARALTAVEGRFTGHVLTSWRQGLSSLRSEAEAGARAQLVS